MVLWLAILLTVVVLPVLFLFFLFFSSSLQYSSVSYIMLIKYTTNNIRKHNDSYS